MLTNVQSQSPQQEGLLIHIKRSSENNVHTYGSFVLKDSATEQALAGYSIEPGGLTGPLHLSGKRLPAGTYRVSWQFIPGDGNRLVLYNARIGEHRRIVLGNTSAIDAAEGYLALLGAPWHKAGSGNSLNEARAMQSKVETLVQKAGAEQVTVQIDDV